MSLPSLTAIQYHHLVLRGLIGMRRDPDNAEARNKHRLRLRRWRKANAEHNRELNRKNKKEHLKREKEYYETTAQIQK
jgi:hypothetical protein